jgi:probable rRNA maturation factor
MGVLIQVDDHTASEDDIAIVRARTGDAMTKLGVETTAEVSVVLTTDDEMRRLNRTFRGIDRPTDVLSFPVDAADIPAGETPYVGDILISVPTAAINARAADRNLVDELSLLAVHGLLHLLGHEDDSERGADAMRDLEVALGVRPAGDTG